MTPKTLLMLAALCILLCVALAISTDNAFAQVAEAGGTKLGTKEFDKDKLPNKWEMGAGFGSIFVMIAVLKWL